MAMLGGDVQGAVGVEGEMKAAHYAHAVPADFSLVVHGVQDLCASKIRYPNRLFKKLQAMLPKDSVLSITICRCPDCEDCSMKRMR